MRKIENDENARSRNRTEIPLTETDPKETENPIEVYKTIKDMERRETEFEKVFIIREKFTFMFRRIKKREVIGEKNSELINEETDGDIQNETVINEVISKVIERSEKRSEMRE